MSVMAATPEDRLRQDLMYKDNLETVPANMAELLEKYSGIPAEQQIDHILRLRNQAYAAYPYPCLGRFRFLEIDLARHPLYRSYVLPTMQGKLADQSEIPNFLELGTCLGQDIRKLIYDGANSDRCFGTDILPAFIDAGYDLFRDEHKLSREHFIAPADVFDNSSKNPLNAFDSKIGIIHATAVFHLFSNNQQKAVARRCLRMLDKSSGRKLILGAQVGHVDSIERPGRDGMTRFRHNEQSWRQLWETVCAEDENNNVVKSVKVEAKLFSRPQVAAQTGEKDKADGVDDGYRWMLFEVWIEV